MAQLDAQVRAAGIGSSGPANVVSTAADGLPAPRRRWAMLAIATGVVMSVLDASIANVALPSISASLHASRASSIWIVNGYQLAALAALLPCAAAGERIGYARVFLAGLALFALGSLACALSPSLSVLVVSRIVQGLGGAGLTSVNGALVRHTYPHHKLGQGVGLNAMAVSLAAAAGPSLSSAILALGPWPWLFAVNVPIALANFVIAARTLPPGGRSGHRFDWKSAALNTAAITLAFVGMQKLGSNTGGANVVAGAEIAVGILLFALLARRELRVERPIIPFDLLRIKMFRLSVIVAIGAFAGYMLLFILLPFHLEGVMRRSQVEAGLLMTPFPLALGVCAPIAGRLADRVGAGVLGAVGMVAFAVSLALLGRLGPAASDADICWRLALGGMGFGLFQPPNNRIMLLAAPRERAGAAGGMLAVSRLVGMIAGAAAAALLLRLFVDANGVGLELAATLAVASAVVSWTRRGRTPTPQGPHPRHVDEPRVTGRLARFSCGDTPSANSTNSPA